MGEGCDGFGVLDSVGLHALVDAWVGVCVGAGGEEVLVGAGVGVLLDVLCELGARDDGRHVGQCRHQCRALHTV